MSGDDPAKREWIRTALAEHERSLTVYVARLLGDEDRARDVVQDAFMKLWQADRATVEGHLAKWLYTVCRNRALDIRRKEHRMTTLDNQRMEMSAAEAPGGRAGDAEDGGDAGDAGAQGIAGMLAAVAGLSARQQEVVRLKFQGELSYREIAEVMDTTVNNVGVLLHTAIRTIRCRMTQAADADASGAGPIASVAKIRDR